MTIDAMIDLETLDSTPTAVVCSVGVVKMDMELLVVPPGSAYRVELHLDWADQQRRGRTIGAQTAAWWLAQSDAAREGMGVRYQMDDGDIGIENSHALRTLCTFLQNVRGVWGNGADFDCVILQSLFRTYDMEAPFKFWQHRCFRTMKSLYGGAKPPRVGTHHRALDDAEYQAGWLLQIMRRLRDGESGL